MLKNLNIPSFKEISNVFSPFIKLADNNKWILLLIMLLIMYLFFKFSETLVGAYNQEGFTSSDTDQRYIFKNKHIYDEFYVKIYDELIEDPNKIEGELLQVIEVSKMDKNSKILDLGSGTGHHVGYLQERGMNVTGLDKSNNMIKQSKQNYPDANFINGDMGDSFLFSSDQFTHITCFYFTLYYEKNKKHLFENCNNWLKDKGYLIFHLVDKFNFDPIVNAADPMHVIDPQHYTDKRIENSIVVFNDFTYKSKFTIIENTNRAKFTELFKFKKNGNIRQNEHILYMERQNEIIQMVKDSGFSFVDRIDLATIGYENQFIYVFQNSK